MTADERLEAFCAFFNKLDKNCTKELYEFYTPDVLFIDPLHRIEGAKALERYFSTLYENVTACRSRFHDRQASGRQAFVTWTPQLRHPRPDGGSRRPRPTPPSPARRRAPGSPARTRRA